MSEQVYMVGLTEEERQTLMYKSVLCGDTMFLVRRLQSARPEHPERQGALEELAGTATEYRDGRSTWVELTQAVDKLRSLEGK